MGSLEEILRNKKSKKKKDLISKNVHDRLELVESSRSRQSNK